MSKKIKKIRRFTLLHLTLILGSVIFSFPFYWLVSTSFKANREIFTAPPRWVPAVPYNVKESPYVAGREYVKPLRPNTISKTTWQQVLSGLPQAVWPEIVKTLQKNVFPGESKSAIETRLKRILGNQFGLLKERLIYGATQDAFRHPEIFQKLRTPSDILAYLQSGVRPKRVLKIWGDVFRNFGFGVITYQDAKFVEHTIAAPGKDPLQLWQAASPNAHLLPLRTISGRRALEIAYNVSQQKQARFVYSAKISLPADSLRRFVIPIKGDESYYKLHFRLDTPQGVFVGKRSFLVDVSEWKQGVWQFQKPEKRYEMEHIQLVRASDLTSHVRQPGQMQITLTLEKLPYSLVIAEKFLRSYFRTFRFIPFLRFLWNTIILVILNVGAQLFACSIVAYGFSRIQWPGRDAVFVLLLATMMIPGQVTMIPQFLIWRSLGMYDTFQPLWLPSLFGSGFFIFLMRQFFMTIPTDLEDAARIDGANWFTIYRRIMLPLIRPALAAVAIFQFMGAWNNFMGPLIYISSEKLTPLSLGLFMLRSQHSSEWGMLMAASTMMTLPIILIFFFTQRYFIQGVTLTGMKD